MKPNALSKPSLANIDVHQLLANAPESVAKDDENEFDWDNAIVSHHYTELKQQLKQPITIRLDSDILSAFKATGKGWQTRINETLRQSLINQGKFGISH